MKPEIKKIVDLILEKQGFQNNHKSFENENFIYWICNDRYYYDNNQISRDEFVCVQEYSVKFGTLPNVERMRRNMTQAQRDVYDKNFENSYKNSSDPEVSTGTYSRETIIRYSKLYNSLEYYKTSTDIRAPFAKKTRDVIIMRKKHKIFSINNKGYINFANKWLSLKNWNALKYNTGLGEKLMIELMVLMTGKDWVRELSIEDVYMITNKNVRKSNSLQEAFELECGGKPAKNIERILDNDMNSIINLYNVIERNQINYITGFILKNKKMIDLMKSNRHSGNKHVFLIFLYFLCRDNCCEYHVINDYLKMLNKLGKKVNLKISSYTTLKSNHDKASKDILLRESRKGRLRIKKVYPNIKSTKEIEVEKIRTVSRLKEESSRLHHCVVSYKDRINRGECAIYSLSFMGNSYTLELHAKEFVNSKNEKEYKIHANQLRGLFNCDPPLEMKELFLDMCLNSGITSINISFSNSVKNRKKEEKRVKHIGEKILDRFDEYGNFSRVYEDTPIQPENTNINPVMERVMIGYDDEFLPF